MARKLRMEYAGAIYHVLNRGNYRRDVFQSAGEAQAFLKTLEEAVQRHGWRLHAFVVMKNHYHLALETPEPNLVSGMHWLQSTFATRFNRLRGERGHLFQGRYQSLAVENTAALSRLVDYIHLNPVRARIVPAEQVMAFRWSSLGWFVKGRGFGGLEPGDWLGHLGLSGNPAGWTAYVDHLRALADDGARQKEMGFETMSKGWSIGTDAWRRALAKEHQALALQPGLPAAELRAMREAHWEEAVLRELGDARKDETALRGDRKFAPWKVLIAARLRAQGFPVTWLTKRLWLGSADSARVYLSKALRN